MGAFRPTFLLRSPNRRQNNRKHCRSNLRKNQQHERGIALFNAQRTTDIRKCNSVSEDQQKIRQQDERIHHKALEARRKTPPMTRRHVVPTGDNWLVKVERTSNPESSHSTQAEAEAAAKRATKSGGGGEVVIHRPDGRIRDSDTIAPARDPFPPRDKKN